MGGYLAEVLPYWEREIDRPELAPWKRYQAWYAASDRLGHFVELVETLLAEPTGARDIPNTAATVILLDQFTRKIYAGEARAYAGHENAAAIAAPLLARGDDEHLPLVVRIALAMALCNVEQAAQLEQAEDWFRQQQGKATGEDAALVAGFTEIASRRREILATYGRFPGRNQALGRASTPAEAYLLVGHAIEVS